MAEAGKLQCRVCLESQVCDTDDDRPVVHTVANCPDHDCAEQFSDFSGSEVTRSVSEGLSRQMIPRLRVGLSVESCFERVFEYGRFADSPSEGSSSDSASTGFGDS